jgi:hypothetical protein
LRYFSFLYATLLLAAIADCVMNTHTETIAEVE